MKYLQDYKNQLNESLTKARLLNRAKVATKNFLTSKEDLNMLKSLRSSAKSHRNASDILSKSNLNPINMKDAAVLRKKASNITREGRKLKLVSKAKRDSIVYQSLNAAPYGVIGGIGAVAANKEYKEYKDKQSKKEAEEKESNKSYYDKIKDKLTKKNN